MELNSNKLKKVPRKRTVNKEEWTKEKRKRLRIAGKEYINAKGQIVSEKQPGPDCKCRRRCYEKVPQAARMKLFKGYYALKSHDEQNAYLFGLIRKVPIARKRAEGSTRRTCTFNYYIRVGGQETQVCVKALANIHGVGKSKIHILCEKLGQNILFPRDERGRHSKMPKKVSDETLELVREHICGILHSDRVRDFLKDEKANNGPDVNITQMHKDFLDTYDPSYQDDVIEYERRLNLQCDEGTQRVLHTTSVGTTFEVGEYRPLSGYVENSLQSGVPIKVFVEDVSITPISATHGTAVVHNNSQTESSSSNSSENGNCYSPISNSILQQQQPRRKRKTTKDGRPEPLIRQWYYSKIFHELYTTKEAIALRKKIINWKSAEECQPMVVSPSKPTRKPKTMKKSTSNNNTNNTNNNNNNYAVQVNEVPILVTPDPLDIAGHVIEPHQHPQQNFETDVEQQIEPRIIHRIGKTINTLPTILHHPPKIELQVQNMPFKKKPMQLQVLQATTPTGQEQMYSIYPMILQDFTGLEGQAVNLAQPLQQAQIRTITATPHFQAIASPMTTGHAANTMNIAGNLQFNINLPTGTYTAANGIMQYKFE